KGSRLATAPFDSLVYELPNQLAAALIQRVRIFDTEDVAGNVLNHEPAVRGFSRPSVERRLKGARALRRFHLEATQLEVFFHRVDPLDDEDEACLGQCLRERGARSLVQICRVMDQRQLFIILRLQGNVAFWERPRKAAPQLDRRGALREQ